MNKSILKQIIREEIQLSLEVKSIDKVQPTVRFAASLLGGLRKKITGDGYKKIISVIKNYKGPKNTKSILTYVNKELSSDLNEGIFDFFRNKEDGKANVLSKSILSAIAFLILFNVSTTSFAQAESLSNTVPPSIEKPIDGMKSAGVSDNNQTIYLDIDNQAATIVGADVDFKANTVSVDNDEIKLTQDTGEFEVKNSDQTVKQIGDEIAKKLDGKSISKDSKIFIKGLISNTPGDNDDNPVGSDKDGLADKRLQAGMSLVDALVDYLTETYPDQFPDAESLKGVFADGGTNLGNLGNEVEVGSPEALKSQGISFDLGQLSSETTADNETDNTDSGSPNPNNVFLNYFKNPKQLAPDVNKYYTILAGILPLITNNQQPTTSIINLILSGTKEDQVINDNFVAKKLSELQRNDTPDAKKAIQILTWARNVKKDPKVIANFFNKLDNNISISPEKRTFNKPGEKGKSAFTGGSQVTQAGTLDEYNLIKNLYNSLINEATTSEWEQLPDYDATKAKENLGLLVPLYLASWGIVLNNNNNVLSYVSGINKDGSLNKSNPYKKSWDTFANKYPVIKQKIYTDPQYQFLKTNNKGKDSVPVSFDSKDVKNTLDTNKLIKTINSNSALKNQLNRINTVDEFKQLILIILQNHLPSFNKDKSDKDKNNILRNILSKVKARIQPRDDKGRFIKEIATLPDVVNNEKVIDTYSSLKTVLSQFNTEEEIIQLIIRGIIPYLSTDIRGRGDVILKQAINKAITDLSENILLYNNNK